MSIVSHIKDHDKLGIPDGFATLPAKPPVAADYAALGVGASATASVHAASSRVLMEPFAMPSGGVAESITVNGYGNAGNTGVACTIRWGIASILPDPTSPIGLRVGDILAQGLSTPLNTSEGFVTLATGQAIVVPPLFGVLLKQGYTATATERFGLRRTNFPSTLPGIPAVRGGTDDFISTAQIVLTTTDSTVGTPAVFAAGSIMTLYNHRPVVSVAWRAA